MTKTVSYTAEDLRNERDAFFRERGFGYEAETINMLYSALSTAGSQSVNVAVVDSAYPGKYHYYYGYAGHVMEAQDRVRAILRTRKYVVVHASVFQVVNNGQGSHTK